jgi:acetyl/propionyl-CoA carboxylase alpha subunit
MEIPIYYDPMIAKLISHGKDREEAIDRMIRAIDSYKITGIETTLPFCRFVLNHNAFASGNYDTHFVKDYYTPESLNIKNDNSEIAALVISRLLKLKKSRILSNLSTHNNMPKKSNWRIERL